MWYKSVFRRVWRIVKERRLTFEMQEGVFVIVHGEEDDDGWLGRFDSGAVAPTADHDRSRAAS